MARTWRVPVQIVEEERVIGGRWTVRQGVYLLAVGPGLGGLLALIPAPVAVRLLLFGLGVAVGAAPAYGRLYNMSLDTFLWRWWKWRRSPRRMYLRGDD
jgi:hypothetical protein